MKKLLTLVLTIAIIAMMSVSVFAAPGDNIAPNATIDAPYCSAWESAAVLNDGYIGEETFAAQSLGLCYGSWGMNVDGGSGATPDQNWETITYTWDSEVTVDSVGVFFWTDGQGIHLPYAYTVKYWNGSEYVEVKNAQGLEKAEDVINVTKFDAVTTTSIQLYLLKVSETDAATIADLTPYGIGLFEFLVYEAEAAADAPTDEPKDEPKDEPTDDPAENAPQTGFATAALAIVAITSGAYIVSKKH